MTPDEIEALVRAAKEYKDIAWGEIETSDVWYLADGMIKLAAEVERWMGEAQSRAHANRLSVEQARHAREQLVAERAKNAELQAEVERLRAPGYGAGGGGSDRGHETQLRVESNRDGNAGARR